MTSAANITSDNGTSSLPELLASSSNSAGPSVLTAPDNLTYLSHLTTLPLSTLQSEPTALSSSSAQLTNALTTLCHTSYPTFLSLHTTAATLSSSLDALSSSLDLLLSALPALEGSAKSFAQETREIQKERRKANLILEHHDKLYDVLSLPLLLDSCVRNHNYNEALLLSNHCNTLSQRFPSNPLVQSVKVECDARVQAMLGHLLGMLSEQAKLPALFRAVNFLRKMDVLEEEELALAFLTGRGVYLSSILKAVDTEKKSEDKETYARYLKRYVDVWREGVYDVVTQYTTIFLDRAPSTSKGAPRALHSLLTTFTTHHLQALLSLLRETLPQIPDPSLLTSLLTQLTYCANSFARVGMDFKALLAPIFVDAVRKGVTQELQEASNALCGHLNSRAPKSVQEKSRTSFSGSTMKKPSQLLVAPSSLPPSVPTPAQIKSLSSGQPNVPPQLLISYPPLAIYTNAILTALNGLRMLAPVELLNDLLSVLDLTLSKGASALLRYAREKPWLDDSKATEGNDKEEEAVNAACSVYFKVVIPFTRRALVEGVYGSHVDQLGGVQRQELREVIEEWEASSRADTAGG